METDSMVAGPALNVKVGVEVMEWGQPNIHPCLHWCVGKRTVYADKWSPSTDWSMAGEVLERLQIDGWPVNLWWDSGLRVWRCGLGYRAGKLIEGRGEKGPLAICLAAVRAQQPSAQSDSD